MDKIKSISIQVFIICIGHDVAYAVPMFMNIANGDIHPGKWSDPYIARVKNAVEIVAAVATKPKQKHLTTVYRRWVQGLDTCTPFIHDHIVSQANLNIK